MTRRHDHARDAGTTLAEVMISVTLFAIVSTAACASLVSASRTQANDAVVVQARRTLRIALADVARDLRSATLVVTPPTSAGAASQIDVVLPSGLPVRYRVDSTGLVRETLASVGGAVTGTRAELGSGVDVAGPVFAYFGPSGSQLVTGVVPAATLSSCTTRVRVTLSVLPGMGRAAVTDSTDVSLRSIIPGSLSC